VISGGTGMVGIEDFSRVVQTIYAAGVEPNDWAIAMEEIKSAVGSRSRRS
jgi:hypothetical protein